MEWGAERIPSECAVGFDIVLAFRYVVSGSRPLVSITAPDGFADSPIPSTLATKDLDRSCLRRFEFSFLEPIPGACSGIFRRALNLSR